MNLFEIIANLERSITKGTAEFRERWDEQAAGGAKADLVALMGEQNAVEMVGCMTGALEAGVLAQALGAVPVHEAQQTVVCALALAYARGKADGLSQAFPERG